MPVRDDGNGTAPRIVAFSDALGPIECQVVGRNRSQYLVHAYGVTIPVPKDRVFELAEGWELRDGQIKPLGHEPTGEEAPALLQYEMDPTPAAV